MTVRIHSTRQSLLLRLKDSADGPAWIEFQTIYRPAVYRFARRHGVQPADAEDLSQQVMLAVAKKISVWNPDSRHGSFRAWLLTVTRNAVSNLVSRSRPDAAAGGTGPVALLTQAVSGEAAKEEIDWELRRATFRWAAEEVRREYQPATWNSFWLTAVERQSAEQVADDLGLSIGAVYTNRSRVLKRLREWVQRLEDQPGETL